MLYKKVFLVLIILVLLQSIAQASRTVAVDTNGVLQYPTNFWDANAANITVTDSAMLGGELPSYYATTNQVMLVSGGTSAYLGVQSVVISNGSIYFSGVDITDVFTTTNWVEIQTWLLSNWVVDTYITTASSTSSLGTHIFTTSQYPSSMLKTNNLNDLSNAGAARTNLGLGALAVQNGRMTIPLTNNYGVFSTNFQGNFNNVDIDGGNFTNCTYSGDGQYLTNISVYAAESDPWLYNWLMTNTILSSVATGSPLYVETDMYTRTNYPVIIGTDNNGITPVNNDVFIGKDSLGYSGNNIAIGGDSKAYWYSTALGVTAFATNFSVALGENCRSLTYSFTGGHESDAYTYSTAIGYYSYASYYGFAVGERSKAILYSTALGSYSSASNYSFAAGRLAHATNFSMAFGYSAEAKDHSFSFGGTASDTGIVVGSGGIAQRHGIAFGGHSIAQDNSIALGRKSRAQDYSIAIGDGATGITTSVSIGYTSRAEDNSIAIGHNSLSTAASNVVLGVGISNEIVNSTRVMGAIYLDGATNIYYRPVTGTGAWSPINIVGGTFTVTNNGIGTTNYTYFEYGIALSNRLDETP